ncbi:monooxygenase [Fibrella aquatica]|uniref:monooxygenase n=1 Tax=Fibrella aquatica TaxID=3242487 RepID=UPI0035223497
MVIRILVGSMLAASVLFGSCQPADNEAAPDSVASDFGLIQTKILTPSCATAGCHASEADPSFKQHGLVLAASVAYQNMVGIDPKNTNSKADGHQRVKPFVAQQSLLYHKLYTDATHHNSKNYGNPMPLGMEALSVGQIEFVRRWIDGGAKASGQLIDPSLLDDKTPSTAPNSAFTPPTAPAAGQGFQLAVEAFDVASNFERELFVRRAVGNSTDIYVNRFTVSMRPGSHHFIAYDFNNKSLAPPLNQVRDLRNVDGTLNLLTALQMSNHTYLMGSPNASFEFKFPEGAALLIPANASVDLNVHYVNKSQALIKGESYINLYTTPQSSVTKVVKTLNMSNTNLAIPAKSRVTLNKTFTMSKPSLILSLTSHMHKMGEKFVIKIKGGPRDGEVVYTTTDWEHPDVINFATPIQLAKGEGLTSEITYNNTSAKAIQFGLTSDDEMGIIFGYYYEL